MDSLWCDECQSFHPETTPHVSEWRDLRFDVLRAGLNDPVRVRVTRISTGESAEAEGPVEASARDDALRLLREGAE